MKSEAKEDFLKEVGLGTRKRHSKLSHPTPPCWRELISRVFSQLIRPLPRPRTTLAQLIGAFSLAAYGVKKNVPQPPTVTSTGVSTSASECYYQHLGPQLAHGRGAIMTHGVLGKISTRAWVFSDPQTQLLSKVSGCFCRDELA